MRVYPRELQKGEVRVSIAGSELVLEITATASSLAAQGQSRPGHPQIVGCITFVDITERRRLEARTAQLAWYDTLTGLPNRNSFTEALRSAIQEARERGDMAALLFFDIDRFKNVNDTLGHHFGDLLLIAIARKARALLGESDYLVRLGGDEFAVIVRDADEDDVRKLAARVVTSMSEPFMVEGYRVAIGASVGIAFLGRDSGDPSVVMKRADLALHAAKADGGGYRAFTPTLDEDLDERRRIEVALWDTLQTGQLEVEYQPQVHLGTGELIGCEALSRWTHREMGRISPGRFVPIAEATGLIYPIGTSVLATACREIEPFGDLKVAVNVSPVQFVRGDLTRAVADALSASGMHPSRLELEITESLFLNNGALVAEKMRELIDLGVSFALDDFGTGYSSLSYVRKYPVDKIKIDRSFVVDILTDRSSAAIVGAVVAMAEGMQKRVIAEGIETEEQRRILQLLGCQEGQGFLFGKSVPAAELAAIVAAAPDSRSQLTA
jgi:diguanylate cyclase (GGDEF)-like protein